MHLPLKTQHTLSTKMVQPLHDNCGLAGLVT